MTKIDETLNRILYKDKYSKNKRCTKCEMTRDTLIDDLCPKCYSKIHK